MIFEKNHIYHVFNQGNKRGKVFFSRDNHLFFLKKIKTHISPFADILAWCLMPNYFHLMIYVNDLEIPVNEISAKNESKANPAVKYTSLNKSIDILLSSYTRAVNLQNGSSGSVFRQKSKALCLNSNDKLSKAWYYSQGVARINLQVPKYQYPNVCYNYILNNPVKSWLVATPEDWEFSSYLDICGTRKGKLLAYERIKELGLVFLENKG